MPSKKRKQPGWAIFSSEEVESHEVAERDRAAARAHTPILFHGGLSKCTVFKIYIGTRGLPQHIRNWAPTARWFIQCTDVIIGRLHINLNIVSSYY